MTKATELQSFAWRDPAYVAQRLEETTCTGCAHKQTGKAFGVAVTFCEFRKSYDGIRCRHYKE